MLLELERVQTCTQNENCIGVGQITILLDIVCHLFSIDDIRNDLVRSFGKLLYNKEIPIFSFRGWWRASLRNFKN
jgi:hypothetical protein